MLKLIKININIKSIFKKKLLEKKNKNNLVNQSKKNMEKAIIKKRIKDKKINIMKS